MGSYSEANGYNIDSRVGGLVWVRRRNGSWCPGRILCPDGLPKSCLLSPRRSGTPVQLIGREDASVEWYNLEKSNRVKPFQCGEYEECIEKAKVTDKLNGLDSISISPQELPHTAAAADDSFDCSSEDDETEGSRKRMRGLDDLGIGRAIPSFDKKRSRVVHINDILKKKNRCHQLTKVLNKTEMVTIPLMCEEVTGSFSEYKISHSTDSVVNSDNDANGCKQKDDENSSNSELLETDHSSRRLFDAHYIREEKCTAVEAVQTVSAEPDEFQESGLITSGVDINHVMDNGTSKWQDKGKIISRNKNKTKPVQNILHPRDELRKVNNLVDLTAQQSSMPIRQYRSKYIDTGSLYDVNLEVKAGHFTRHLPFVSFLSNFTGQPVTGHSLEVEVLNGTVSDLSLNSFEK